ncbi:MAG: UDP-N-acetylmuramoyl-tripeptide--D-alanyl-D-alanine ligase [Patescibacteria group bacterium]|mgnify:CR=1 FL=1
MNPIIKWWVTTKLPEEHVFLAKEKNVRPLEAFVIYIKRLFFHPIKRRVAKYYLEFLRAFFGIKVIGVTGSAGKTTTKEMLASILRMKGKTVSSLANIDPIYNIPTTILKCGPLTKYLVLEMGVEFPGEMDFYLWLTKPDMGVITNIYPTHTQFFEDEEGVYKEKSKLVRALSGSGIAVLNKGDRFLSRLEGKIRAKTIWYGVNSKVTFSSERVTKDFKSEFRLIFKEKEERSVKIKLPVFGKQFIFNALAAAGASCELGVLIADIKEGLENFQPQKHRLEVIRHKSGAIILDDTYNSNPAAAKVALETLSLFRGEKVVIFGDMLELGKWEEKYHKELGEEIAKISPSMLICVGEASRLTAETASVALGEERVKFLEKSKVFTELKPFLRKNVTVLIKGSRSLGLDKIVSRLS